MEKITIEEFKKIDLRVGKIIEVKDLTEKLYVLKVDLGNEVRTVIAGIKKWYKPEELIGKYVILVANLEPKEIRGVKSEGMILAADDGETVSLITVDKEVKPGAKIY